MRFYKKRRIFSKEASNAAKTKNETKKFLLCNNFDYGFRWLISSWLTGKTGEILEFKRANKTSKIDLLYTI